MREDSIDERSRMLRRDDKRIACDVRRRKRKQERRVELISYLAQQLVALQRDLILALIPQMQI